MKSKQTRWFLLALLAGLLLAPSPLTVKSLADDVDPYLLNALRFGIAALLLLPWTIRWAPRLLGRAKKPVFLAASLMTVSASSLVLAVYHGPASYVATLQLLSPLLLVWYSRRLLGERIRRGLLVGFLCAAAGATVMTLLPIALHQKSPFVFYPLATLFGLVSVLVYPLATVQFRKAHETFHAPLSGLIGLSAWCVAAANGMLWLVLSEKGLQQLSPIDWTALIYMGVFVSLLSKVFNIRCYEKVGSAVMGGVSYLSSLLSVVLPIIVLGESLPLEIALGGCLIVLGLAVAESHARHPHLHRHIFHHH